MKLFTIVMMVASLGMSHAFAGDGKDEAIALVKKVIEVSKKDGKESAIAQINKGGFNQGELYPVAYDFEGKCLAHGTKPARAGQNMIKDKDPDGKFFVKDRIEIAKKGSGWQRYRFPNPVTKKIEDKDMYIEAHDGVIWCAGAYSK